MNIDLIYFYRPYSTNFYLYGPEKVNNNIVVDPNGVFVFSSESAVFQKIEEMYLSLSPEITNINIKSSVQFTSDFKMRVYTGELNAGSDVPDYTQILTSINTNLTNLNSKFEANGSSIALFARGLFNTFNNGSVNGSTEEQKNTSFIRNAFFYNGDVRPSYGIVRIIDSCLTSIYNMLRQSVSPNSSITDVISLLNTNIHNDLTNINTTTENKDNVLIIDGQQTFKIRNSDEEI